jgi:hypothetical protein
MGCCLAKPQEEQRAAKAEPGLETPARGAAAAAGAGAAAPLTPAERTLGVQEVYELVVHSPGKAPCRGQTVRGKPCGISVPKAGSGYCYLHGRQAAAAAASAEAAASPEGRRAASAALALREAAEREGARSAKKEAAARAGALVCSRKARVFLRVRGIDNIRVLQTRLGDMLRDLHARDRKAELRRALGEGAYYTRARAHKPQHAPDAHGAHVEVDHVFECQMLGHAIVQSEAFHELGWLQAVDLTLPRTHQPSGLVRSGLEGLFAVQNCTADASFFNLRLLDKSLNITKGGVVRNWLEGRYAGGEAAGLTGLRAGFRQSSAVRAGVITAEEGDELAAALRAAMGAVEAPYLDRLEALREAPPATAATLSERTAHSNRLAGLMESVQLLLDELDGIE